MAEGDAESNYKLAFKDTRPAAKNKRKRKNKTKWGEENMIWDDVCDGEVTHSNAVNTRIAPLFPGGALSQSPRGQRPFIQSH